MLQIFMKTSNSIEANGNYFKGHDAYINSVNETEKIRNI